MTPNPRKTIILALALTLITCAPIAARLTDSQLYELAHQGHQLFRQANELIADHPDQAHQLYDQAILHFRSIIDQGNIANWALYYNIANAHLLKGDLGRAILNYRRAQKLTGANQQLHENLAFARTRRLDQIPVKTARQVLKTLFFWYYDISSKTRFVLACWLFACCCALATLWLWWPRARSLRWLALVMLLVVLSLAGSVALDAYRARTDIQGVITTDSVIARQGDAQNYPPSFTEPLHSGAEFRQLEQRGRWRHIELNNGSKTWIPLNAAEII